MYIYLLISQLVEILAEWVRHADVVDEHADVQATDRIRHLLARGLVEVGEINGEGLVLCLGVLLADLPDGVVELALRSADEQHVESLLGQLLHESLANAI